jgi:phosphodiesterase/alkaline phosphatase D-like protein
MKLLALNLAWFLLAPADSVNGGKPLTFAVFSCSQFQSGWFNAYGYAATKTQPDLYIHLGDYVRAYLTSLIQNS